MERINWSMGFGELVHILCDGEWFTQSKSTMIGPLKEKKLRPKQGSFQSGSAANMEKIPFSSPLATTFVSCF